MRTDLLDGLVVFQAVAHARSFTAAAAILDVSPQAVSQSLKALEARLDVRLLNRSTRSVALTEAGERFLAHVGPAIADLSEATERLRSFSDKPAGVLRLDLPRSAFTGLVRPRLDGFRARYPEIQLELSINDTYVDIVERGMDAGIRLGDALQQDMISVPLSRHERLAIMASPDYLARKGVPETLAQLIGHDCIRFRFAHGGTLRWTVLDDGLLKEIEVRGSIVVNDSEAMLDLALSGFGLVYALESAAADLLTSNRLVRVLTSICPVVPGFHLYYPNRHHLPMKLRCFIEHFRQS
ncbi:MAG: LysR family transcriptional regulator [Burkholderiales bacterium]|nr:LysR family transcriptional regulator [Burkholderiales bacterium]